MKNPFINNDLLRLHHLIKIKATGCPKTLARKLECSERTARLKIEQLKEAGFPVAYCRYSETYYYTEEVSISVTIVLGDKEMRKIVGGTGIATTEERLKSDYLHLGSKSL